MLDNDRIREILKKRKEELEVPWRVIAEKAGISLSTLAKYIYGDNAMRTELLIYVLEAVGMELIIREKELERGEDVLTEREYNEAPGIRRSALWRMHESPEKYKWFLEHPETPTPALIFGAAVHKLLLEPVDFEDEYAVAPPVDRRTKAGKEAWEEFVQMAGSKTVISQDDFDIMEAMVEKANSVPYVKELLKGKHEVPLFWTDEDTGLECKAKLDILADMDGRTVIADYKSAANAKTEIFNSKIFSLGYHLQAYMYAEGAMKALGLAERPDFIFIVQEKTAPYAVNLIEVPEDVMLAGMDCFREYIGLVHQCKETDFWWGYTGMYGEPNEAFLPGWMQMGEEE